MQDIMASSVHLKIKYHNLHGEPTIINIYIEGAKIIYQALQRDQGEGIAMEINMASLSSKLRDMNILPPRRN